MILSLVFIFIFSLQTFITLTAILTHFTDAAMAQRAECVMLNKGPYIQKAVKMLDKILRKMQKIQKKNDVVMPKLQFSEEL